MPEIAEVETVRNTLKKRILNKKIIDLKIIYPKIIVSHLRMEGKYFIKDIKDQIEKHEHIIFTFKDNTELRYHDTRKFGRMKIIKKEDLWNTEEIKKQGREPLDKNLNGTYLQEKFKNKNMPMKTILLDQEIISGLGNIYADEVLYAAKINPLRKAKTLTLEECEKICKSAKEIIEIF